MNSGGRVRLVKGPAVVRVSGRCSVLGCDLSDSEVRIRQGKILPFELEGRTRLDVTLGAGAKAWPASPFSAGTRMWRAVVKNIVEHAGAKEGLKVLVLGDSNAGKSTFCLYLANRCISAGMKPCIVDSDIGQSDLGPPGVVTFAAPAGPATDLRDAVLRCRKFRFIGSISPPGFEHQIIGATRDILESEQRAYDIFIVNTDGYIAKQGAQYKLRMARELLPDVLVCLGAAGQALCRAYRGRSKIMRARSSRFAAKSPQERTARRNEQFANFLGQDRILIFPTSKIRLVYRDGVPTKDEVESLLGTPGLLFVGLALGVILAGFGAASIAGTGLIGIQTGYPGAFDTVLLSDITLSLDYDSDGQSARDRRP